eukprot:2588925-Prymnesium_polylepis.5
MFDCKAWAYVLIKRRNIPTPLSWRHIRGTEVFWNRDMHNPDGWGESSAIRPQVATLGRRVPLPVRGRAADELLARSPGGERSLPPTDVLTDRDAVHRRPRRRLGQQSPGQHAVLGDALVP